MKRILFVNHVSQIGGGSYCLLNVLKKLDRNSILPIVLLAKNGPLVDEIEKLGIPVYYNDKVSMMPLNKHLSLCNFIKEVAHALISMISFYRTVRHIDCDVVYINSMMLYHYLIPSKVLRKKTITHIRENWPIGNYVIQRSFIETSLRLFSDHILAINKYSAQMFKHINSSRLSVVYDWIDMDARYVYYPLDKIFNEDTHNLKVFLYTGGPNPIKGPKEVITVFSKVMRNASYRLLVIGSLDEFLKQDKSIADMIISDKRIKCIPSLYEITHLIQQSYCVLSFFTRPHANLTLAESVILQTPMVAATTPEALEYSNNGQLAILFPFGDLNSYVAKLSDIDNLVARTKIRLSEDSSIIKELFDTDRNSKIINNVLKSM